MSNALRDESSPYLRQHADNPVHWWPWCSDALKEARERDVPILLSIGYSACHWCHVMAHECFENDTIAALMNAGFVNIKVDREERPDLDRIYQLAHNALTGRGGGWPLTVFLTPHDLLPFFAGTYFPPAPRHGLPSFPQVLDGIARYFRERRDEITTQNSRLQAFLDDQSRGDGVPVEPSAVLIDRALEALGRAFDPMNGGHKGAPKFPHAAELRLWLRAITAKDGGESDAARPRAERIVRTTLDAMADRGLHDHLGGGFFRYCVDDDWTIPHFEKMLYDNAQLLPVYAEAALLLGEWIWLDTIDGTLRFLECELRGAGGGLYCALDADSPGGEGAYYVWTPEQVAAELPAAEADEFITTYGLDGPPNFEGEAWHLVKRHAVANAVAGVRQSRRDESGETPRLANDRRADEANTRLERSRKTLLTARSRRSRPGLDDKVLTSWNALTIAGLARTARALRAMAVRAGPASTAADASAESSSSKPSQHDARAAHAMALADRAQMLADDALDHLHAHAWRDGRLCADTTGRFPGYLDDHAFLLDALVEQLQQRWTSRDANWAQAIADALLERFEDAGNGGFWFTAHDHEPLPQRPKPWTDDATPSGNAVAIRSLQALGHLFGETRWLDASDRGLRAGAAAADSHPHAAATFLLALHDGLEPPRQIVVRTKDAPSLDAWRHTMRHIGIDADHCYFLADAQDLPPILAAMVATPNGLAYVCERGSCSPPVGSAEELRVLVEYPAC